MFNKKKGDKMKKVNEKLFNQFLKPKIVDSAVIKHWNQFKKAFPVSFITTKNVVTHDQYGSYDNEVLKDHLILTTSELSN